MFGSRVIAVALLAIGLAMQVSPGHSQELGVDCPGKVHPSVATLSKKIQAQAIYPTVAALAGKQGIVVTGVTLRRNGELVSARVLRTSGNQLIDDSVIDAIRRAAPFPPPPANFEGDPVEIVVTLQAMIRRRS